MLRFTNAQEQAVIAARRQFNESQTAMASRVSLIGNASPVPIDAWRRIDSRSTQIQRDILAVFNKLSMANSTPVGLGDLVSYFPKVGDSGSVSVTMDGRHVGSGDAATVQYEGTPVPIFTGETVMGWRQMEVVRKGQTQMDAESVANDVRKVAEKAEDMVLNGLSSIVVNGATIYGLRNHPQRNTGTHGLTLQSSTGAQWLGAFEDLLQKLVADNAFGRVSVFLNYGDWLYADVNEFTSGYPKTILQRLLEIQQVAEIVPCSKCTANEIIGVAGLATGAWGSMLNAMPMVTRPKMRQNPEDDYVFGTMMAAAPQFRVDADGRTQLAHLTAS